MTYSQPVRLPGADEGVRGWTDFFRRMKLTDASPCLDGGGPCIVLDDARERGRAFALLDPVRVLTAHSLAEVRPVLEKARDALRAGQVVAGYFAYEAGAAFEPRLERRIPIPGHEPLVWLCVFDRVFRLNDLAALLPEPAALPESPVPCWSSTTHRVATERILAGIRAGDIYQVNLTFPVSQPISAAPEAHYAWLRGLQRAGWGGIVRTGTHSLLSFSPELFFTLTGSTLESRPMKGTSARSSDAEADRKQIEMLRTCSKERAENLMIVDLLRNDFSRISRPGSVKVPDLFSIETYPTVHQMTSRIQAQLRAGMDAIDVFEACFPCGSITGAPKIRAMEIIAETEMSPRGSYTGSMGVFLPDGSAAFNVMIRTLSIPHGERSARLDVGSGITIGSVPELEWQECLTKLRFTGFNPIS